MGEDAGAVTGERRAAIVGAGIIGASWALVFARAGWSVRVYARHDEVRRSLHDRVRRSASASLELMPGLSVDDLVARIRSCNSLEEAVGDAAWVQESVEESRDAKAAAFAAMDRHAPGEAVLASSTSSIGASHFTADLPGRHRALVAHPATPPHLIPVVEVVPAPWTDPAVTRRAMDMLRAVGQRPVLVRREQPGFVLNRLQGALLIEMFHAIRDGLMSAEDVDALIRDGFALRWAWLGPLEGIDLNAPGGIADYLARYGFMFDQLAAERGGESPVVTPALVDTLHRALRDRWPLDSLADRVAWRDRRMAALRALRVAEDDPHRQAAADPRA